MFNLYGRSAETVDTLLRAFLMVLEPFTTDTITSAFRRWMQTKATMPTPADIRELCLNFQAEKREAKTMPLGKTWTQVFKDESTDAIVAEYAHGRHLPPMYHDRHPNCYVTMRKDA